MSAERTQIDADNAHDASGGNPQTIEDAFRTEAPKLVRYFRSNQHLAHEAEDMVQEAFLRALRYAEDRRVFKPMGLLRRIAKAVVVDRRRRYRSHHEDKHVPIEYAPDIPVAPSQMLDIEAAQLMEAIQRAIDNLPKRTREVFLLHRVDGLKYSDIANHLGISYDTVEWHIGEAIFRIRCQLKEERGR
ncbi:RNA polymerase sigma factor [Sphingobium yanoikuyae]|jgi:RNA polymerase sigma-70 factor (ECF subfamily)|uniref:RNA polymerase sigma factor n=1 Tax=Sphingobium yanoikuyae TaxID=13690 RepID=UPI000689DF72|nr:RNA polymerase sigma factor [Sphingobium yanoikuyae]MDV3482002.1 RNA polymerase sigma factor [Sphingobium yanoikuyae]